MSYIKLRTDVAMSVRNKHLKYSEVPDKPTQVQYYFRIFQLFFPVRHVTRMKLLLCYDMYNFSF